MGYISGIVRQRVAFAGAGNSTITVAANRQANIVYIDGSAAATVNMSVSVGATVVWDGYAQEPFRQNLGTAGVGSGTLGDNITVTASGACILYIGYRLFD